LPHAGLVDCRGRRDAVRKVKKVLLEVHYRLGFGCEKYCNILTT
jgi:hypothetical protein